MIAAGAMLVLASCSSPIPVTDDERQVVSDASLMSEAQRAQGIDVTADEATSVFTANGITPFLPQSTRVERAQQMCDEAESGKSWSDIDSDSRQQIAQRYGVSSIESAREEGSESVALMNVDLAESRALMEGAVHHYCPEQYDEWVAAEVEGVQTAP